VTNISVELINSRRQLKSNLYFRKVQEREQQILIIELLNFNKIIQTIR